MKVIKIIPYRALPCEAEQFMIGEIAADKGDFGSMDSGEYDYEFGEYDDENWACADMKFVPFESLDEKVLAKYAITATEYREIQDKLTEEFCVGSCGWCV